MKQFIYILLIILSMIALYFLNAPRLRAYNECYMQNMKIWGSCNELGGDY